MDSFDTLVVKVKSQDGLQKKYLTNFSFSFVF